MRRIVLLSVAIAAIAGQAQAAITLNSHGVNALTLNALTLNALTLNGVTASGAPLFGDSVVVDVALPAN